MSSTTAHAQSTKFYISKTKVVKPRDGEEEDTITIWDEKLKSTTGSYRWRAFGVKGRENLENLYFGVLSMLQKNYKSIAKESKFAPKSLNNLLSSLNDEDKECLKNKYSPPSDKEEPFTMGELELRLKIADNFPRLGIFLREKAEDGGACVTGIYLFSNELVSLIKWMNKFYAIGSTTFKTYEITDKFDLF